MINTEYNFGRPGVFLSCGCCNNHHKQITINPKQEKFIVSQEARSLKLVVVGWGVGYGGAEIWCQPGLPPSGGPRAGSASRLSSFLAQHSLTYVCFPQSVSPGSAHLLLPTCPAHLRIPVLIFQTHLVSLPTLGCLPSSSMQSPFCGDICNIHRFQELGRGCLLGPLFSLSNLVKYHSESSDSLCPEARRGQRAGPEGVGAWRRIEKRTVSNLSGATPPVYLPFSLLPLPPPLF